MTGPLVDSGRWPLRITAATDRAAPSAYPSGIRAILTLSSGPEAPRRGRFEPQLARNGPYVQVCANLADPDPDKGPDVNDVLVNRVWTRGRGHVTGR